MSFLKKLGRKLGGGRKQREESSANGAAGCKEFIASPITSLSISGGTFTHASGDVINVYSQRIAEHSEESKLFATLNPIPAAHDCHGVTSKLSECFEGTRHQLLNDIYAWMTKKSAPIYILDGIAGIGKTTVLKTVCTQAAAQQRLAASWFFSRDERDRNTTRGFARTLAFQLASYNPVIRDRISRVLRDQPDILQKAVRTQFNALVHEPLQGAFEDSCGTHIISIDAIDECDLGEAVEILSILLSTIPQHPQLRLLITCRPERPFRLLLQRHQGTHVFHLHEIETFLVNADIRLYINHRLSPEQIDQALPDLPLPLWRPSAKEKEGLVQMAGKLFIVASTAVNFVLDPRYLDPENQMRQILDTNTGLGIASNPMDRLYTQVLRAAVPIPLDNWFEDYQMVVGSIVVVFDVLSTQSLASLLNIKPNVIIRTLPHLHSLISPSNSGEAFRIHHKSFPDFVTDPSRCSIDSRFFVDAPKRHFHLAQACLQVMLQMLKPNICNLPPSEWGANMADLPSGVTERIPSELAYACTHWVFHLHQGAAHLKASETVVSQLTTFVDQHFLSWLEVLAWSGRFDTAWDNVNLLIESIQIIVTMDAEATAHQVLCVVEALKDGLRFISLHPEVPQRYPMHIYLSVYPFTPSTSILRNKYKQTLTQHAIHLVSGLDDAWNPAPVSLLDMGLDDAAFSPCGKIVATSCGSLLRLYNPKSGGQIRASYLWGEIALLFPTIIAFSPDGCSIAAGTELA